VPPSSGCKYVGQTTRVTWCLSLQVSQRSTNLWDLDESPASRPVPHATSLDTITRRALVPDVGSATHKVPSRSATVSVCKYRASRLGVLQSSPGLNSKVTWRYFLSLCQIKHHALKAHGD
jgi:hypothetical protein